MDTKLYGEILDNIPSVVFLVNKQLKVKYYNESFKYTFYPKDEDLYVGNSINCAMLLENQLCGSGHYCDKCPLNKILKDAILKGRRVYRQIFEKNIFIDNKEKFFRIRISIKPIRKSTNFVCLMDDITEITDIYSIDRSKRVNKDLKRAKVIQSKFLPGPDAVSPLAKFSYIYNQNYEVGGDFFDLYKISETKYGGYIADVAGAGISGGMFTIFLHDNYNKALESPALALEQLLKKFNAYNFPEESYITMFTFMADIENNILKVCNAGHNIPAILCQKDGIKQISLKGKTISNWYDGFSFNDTLVDYKSDDKLILMTDGIVDMKNPSGVEYSLERALSVIEVNWENDINALVKKFKSDIRTFFGKNNTRNNDDSTLLAIQL